MVPLIRSMRTSKSNLCCQQQGQGVPLGRVLVLCLGGRGSRVINFCPSWQRGERKHLYKFISMGIPWRSSGQDSELPLQGTRVPSLIRELRPGKPRGAVKKQTNKQNKFISSFQANREEQRAFLVSASSQLCSVQNDSYAIVGYFGVAYSATLHCV